MTVSGSVNSPTFQGIASAVTFGNNSYTTAINSSDWKIDTTGNMTGIGTIGMNGLLTASAGATISGAIINLNSSSNFPVYIGAGTSTGAVNIGGGSK